jgi:DNA-binding transcriptional LysR family regulator
LQAVEQTPVELVESLRRGEIDIAMLGVAGPKLHKEFFVRRLGELSALLALSASSPLAKRRKIALADLRAAEWIVWDEKDFPGRVAPLRDAAKVAGFTPRIAGKVDSVASLFVRLANSQAAGYVLPMTKKLPHAGVVFAELRAPGIVFPMDVAWRRDLAAGSPVAVLVRMLATVAPNK